VIFFKEEDLEIILKKFRERTNVFGSILFTEDGLCIANDYKRFSNDDEKCVSIAAISAGIIALAEQGLINFDNEYHIKQVSIQAGHQIDDDGFEILIEVISKDFIIAIIFPNSLNLGVIQFELRQLINKIREYISIVLKERKNTIDARGEELIT